MATEKQIFALIRIIRTIHRRDGLPAPTPEEEADFRRRLAVMSQAEVRERFARLNENTGFDRTSSPATDAQLQVLARHERDYYGRRKTTYRDALTFEQAHARIEELKAAKAARNESKSA